MFVCVTVDQFPPYVVLFSRTKFVMCNHTEVFIVVFNEPVKELANSSLILDNAVVSHEPYPVDPNFPIEWNFRIQPVNEVSHSVYEKDWLMSFTLLYYVIVMDD